MSGAVLLTGATGFVGMEVLARLLEQGEREVMALVRAEDRTTARARVHDVLARLGAEEHAGRVYAIAGDVARPGLGLTRAERDAVAARTGAVVHCAASVSFALGLEQSRAINVQGTRRMLDLAARAPALERFVHVSTAYVAGTHEGPFGEDDLEMGQGFRNAYERSKHEAERLVRARRDLPVSVVRPSIVVGDSRTGWTSAFNVVYFPLHAFARGLATALPADPDAVVDLVPVDYVADGILVSLESAEPGSIALVAGDRAVRVSELAAMAARYFDRPPPRLVGPSDFRATQASASLQVYFPYFGVKARFRDARAGALGLQAPHAAAYFDLLMDFAVASGWGKRPRARPAAAQHAEAPGAK